MNSYSQQHDPEHIRSSYKTLSRVRRNRMQSHDPACQQKSAESQALSEVKGCGRVHGLEFLPRENDSAQDSDEDQNRGDFKRQQQ